MRRRSWSRRGIPLSFWLVALALAGGGFLWWQRSLSKAEPFPDTRSLETATWMEQSTMLRGGSYTLRGTVQQTLAASSGTGRLILVMTLAPRDSEASPEPVPVLVPDSVVARIENGRQFVFKVTVGDAGVLVVQEAAEI